MQCFFILFLLSINTTTRKNGVHINVKIWVIASRHTFRKVHSLNGFEGVSISTVNLEIPFDHLKLFVRFRLTTTWKYICNDRVSKNTTSVSRSKVSHITYHKQTCRLIHEAR